MFHHRLDQIRENLRTAMQRASRPVAETPELVAVSKTHPPEALVEAVNHGLLLFGESRVQEAAAKIPLLPARCRWHFIGHLQKNKIRQALPLFELVHGVDSLQTARDINRIALELALFPRVLLVVNLAGESSKFGFNPEALLRDIEPLIQLQRIQIEGLMTIPPPAPDPESSRRYFAGLRELRERLKSTYGIPLPALSMGMSEDYAVAVEEGSTLVRIGSALFGARSGTSWKPSAPDSLDG
jgi:pyridoxal phosphate enzyme (YggS family)